MDLPAAAAVAAVAVAAPVSAAALEADALPRAVVAATESGEDETEGDTDGAGLTRREAEAADEFLAAAAPSPRPPTLQRIKETSLSSFLQSLSLPFVEEHEGPPADGSLEDSTGAAPAWDAPAPPAPFRAAGSSASLADAGERQRRFVVPTSAASSAATMRYPSAYSVAAESALYLPLSAAASTESLSLSAAASAASLSLSTAVSFSRLDGRQPAEFDPAAPLPLLLPQISKGGNGPASLAPSGGALAPVPEDAESTLQPQPSSKAIENMTATEAWAHLSSLHGGMVITGDY